MARLAVPSGGHTGFTLLPQERTGIWFTNRLSYGRSLTNQNLLNGAGVCAGDFDGDGLPDLYFCNLEGRNALFRNLGGWTFQDVTTTAGVGCEKQVSRGAAFADVNGDGRLDLLVTSLFGPNALFLNEGQGRFRDATEEAGLVLMRMGCESMALGDLNGDGSLDLYLANNGENSILRSGGSIAVRRANGKDQIVGRASQRLKIIGGQITEYGPGDALYFNDGRGHFTRVSWTDGAFLDESGRPLAEAPRDLGLTVAFRDLNGDGAPDIYVCNDFQTPDRIWINDGHGRFRALPDLSIRTTCHFSMCVDFADIDRDGRDDLFVNDMLSFLHRLRMTQTGATNPAPESVGEFKDRQQARRNTLQWNRGDGTYAEIANYAGLDASDWTWSVAFLDVDLDGYEDLLTVNGHAYDTQDMDAAERAPDPPAAGGLPGKVLKNFPPLLTPNYLFRNRGNRTFEEIGARWGFQSTNISHGLSLVDLDNDGDLDVAVSCLWQPPLLYRNDTSSPRVAVRLNGLPPNTQGIGARIVVRGAMTVTQSQEIQCGGRYLAADQAMRVFAVAAGTNHFSIEVRWRSGRRSVVDGAEPNCLYEIDEAGAAPAPAVQSTATSAPHFQDVSDRLAHVHQDPPFNDLERQPLLPKLLSRLGPGLAWHDLDGDGRDELIIGAGRGGGLAVFRSDGHGAFQRWWAPAWSNAVPDDLTGLAGWTPVPGTHCLLAGVSGYETAARSVPQVLRYDVGAGGPLAPQPAVPPSPDAASVGPLAVADVDGDGTLDLFVGERVRPGRYPAAASARIYRNRGGHLELDGPAAELLKAVGLVSGAVFSDLNGDGFPELILAGEWGPLRIYRNERGHFVPWDWRLSFGEASPAAGGFPAALSALSGWWNGVAVGDLDGDGKLDLVASNWGLNSSYHQPSLQDPVLLRYGALQGGDSVELLEAMRDASTGRMVPRRDLAFLSMGWPGLRARFGSHREFAGADLSAVLGEASTRARELRAVTFTTAVFLQRTDHFAVVPLPVEAQFAPAFGVCVGDLDGDGREDLFLSQNFFALRLEEPRLDAGRGLWLRGDGAGRFSAVPGQESGLQIYGEQRGAALADFDGDGRADLAVGQNGGATKLYRNAAARPGLRVRLAGPPGNPLGVGASLRLLFGREAGPLREIHAGAGYWSQDSAVQVLATREAPTQIWVRWPGGRVTTNDVPRGTKEIVVTENAQASVVSPK